MNETNLLAGVEVPEVNKSVTDMYIAQVMLQRRLNQLPTNVADFKHVAYKSIYWGHCIHAEIEELAEWLVSQQDPTWIKEMQMEAIDIFHFVFNIGIEAGFTDTAITDISTEYAHECWEIDTQRIQGALTILRSCVIKYINLLPWKTWKTYTADPDATLQCNAYADVLNATLLLCNTCGLDEKAIVNMYFAKNQVNHERQDNGY